VADLDHAEPARLDALFAELDERARRQLGVDPATPVIVSRAADVRHRGQAHELTVPLPEPSLGVDLDDLAARFRAEYRRVYGIDADAPAQLVAARVRVVEPVSKPAWAEHAAGAGDATPVGERAVRFPGRGGFVETPVYAWDRLGAGARLDGPSLVLGPDTTVVVPPGAHAEIDGARNVRLVPPAYQE
jgi:N-methylhydantoinase A